MASSLSPSSSLPSPFFSSSSTIPEQKPPPPAAAVAAAAVTAITRKSDQQYRHTPTPLHHSAKKTPRRSNGDAEYVAAVSCSDCRFSSSASSTKRFPPPSPGAIIRSLFVSLTRRSTPRSSPSLTPASGNGDGGTEGSDNQQWRLAAADLSRRLLAATRTRDEALQETTRLKHSLAELELKLARLEAHILPSAAAATFPVDAFLRAVASARTAVRHLARALSSHLRSPNPNPNLECFLNRVFHANFELDTEDDVQTPDPAGRCEANLAAYNAISLLTWDEVLLKGTKHYSEGLSRFCDAKMSEVVASLGWARARAWPERLLQAFFLAAKGVWGARLLARSVHPPLPVIRVDRGARFDGRFMEDAAAGRGGGVVAGGRLEPASVKMMVAPGFHVYVAGAGVVKCKVLCLYNSRSNDYRDGGSSVGSVGKGNSCSDMNGTVADVVEESRSRLVT